MKNTKKLMLLAIALVMLVSFTVTNVSANSWKFSGYDTSDSAVANEKFGKIYYEVDDNGIPTNNEKIDGYANKVEWVHDFYEKAFPHAGINRLYIDDVKTSVFKDSGTIANWEKEFRAETWEVKYPYNVFERLWSKVNNTVWTPNFANPERGITNADVLKYLGKQADVTSEYLSFGFDRFRIIDKSIVESKEYFPGKELALRRWFGAKDQNGNYIIDVQDLLSRVGVATPKFPFESDYIVGGMASLSDKDEFGNYIWDDASIAELITTYRSEFLTGPDYKKGGNRVVDSVTYFDEITDSTSPSYDPSASLAWFNPHLIMESDKPATIDWTAQVYEKAFPYNNYQFLIVNGVVLDGSMVAPSVFLPRVFRYTGGQAAPKVEWKYSFAEAAPPHEIYCEKFLDGKATGITASFEERAGRYGVVVYGQTKGELDYKLKSVYGVQDYKSDDIAFSGYTAWVPLTAESAKEIIDATNKAVKR